MNILFITVDQWRGECLSILGHSHVRTPNLDALAADGVCFERHYAQATPCGPSRACLYTGLYLHNHRSLLNGTPLDARHSNIALEARKAGYRPALFGYTDTSLDPRPFGPGALVPGGHEGVLPGMDAAVVLSGDRQPWMADLAAKGYRVPENAAEIFKPQSGFPGADGKGKTYSPAVFKAPDSHTAFLVDEAKKHISRNRSEPWFVHLSLFSPHPPFVVPEPFHAMYDAEAMPLPVRRATPEDEAAQHPWLRHFLFNQRGQYYTFGTDSRDNLTISELDLRQIRATYFGMMSEVDAQIGRLIDHLKRLDCYDDTLIIFTSDHGELLGDHWMFAKYSYHDQSFHVPLIIRLPAQNMKCARGSKISAFTENIDIMPTILEAIGVDIPVQCDGRSLLPLCRKDTPPDWRREIHAEFDLRSPYEFGDDIPLGLEVRQCGVSILRSERYKYVHFGGLPPLFFDLEDDPQEFHDRSADPAYRDLMLDYTARMLSWRMEHDDPALTGLHLAGNGEVLEHR